MAVTMSVGSLHLGLLLLLLWCCEKLLQTLERDLGPTIGCGGVWAESWLLILVLPCSIVPFFVSAKTLMSIPHYWVLLVMVTHHVVRILITVLLRRNSFAWITDLYTWLNPKMKLLREISARTYHHGVSSLKLGIAAQNITHLPCEGCRTPAIPGKRALGLRRWYDVGVKPDQNGSIICCHHWSYCPLNVDSFLNY